MNIHKHLFVLLALAISSASQAAPCSKEIAAARGTNVVTEEEKVFTSIFNAREAVLAKREFWLRKSQLVPLLTFETSYSDDHGGIEELHILDPKTCKELAVLTINSWD